MSIPRTPQLRFLLYALLWFTAALAIWWMLLLNPMLSALRAASELFLRFLPAGEVAQITIQPDGNWLLRMPLPESIGKLESTQKFFGHDRQDGKPVKVRSVTLPMASEFPALFTVGLPLFWALWAAAPYGPNSLQAMLLGSIALGIAGVISLVIHAFCAAAVVLHFNPPGIEGFLLQVGDFIVLDVIPYAAPILLAIGLNRGIQRLVFEGAGATPQPVNIVRRTARPSDSKRTLRRGSTAR